MGRAHNERCRDCKKSIRDLLAAVFGMVEVKVSCDLNRPCRLEDYKGTSLSDLLSTVYEALQKHRGFKLFVGSTRLRPVDFFVPDQRLIVEFDESQHFTKPRDITLSLYPRSIEL